MSLGYINWGSLLYEYLTYTHRYLYVCLSVYLCVCLSTCLFVCLSIVYLYLYFYIFIYHLFICLPSISLNWTSLYTYISHHYFSCNLWRKSVVCFRLVLKAQESRKPMGWLPVLGLWIFSLGPESLDVQKQEINVLASEAREKLSFALILFDMSP